MILFAHYSDSISSKSNHLPSSPTSITHASPSKDVGRVWKCSSMPLKQHGHQPCLPLPSTLPHHLMSSIKNTSPGLLLPSSLPCHLTLSIKDASPPCHCPRPQVSLMPPQFLLNNPDAANHLPSPSQHLPPPSPMPLPQKMWARLGNARTS